MAKRLLVLIAVLTLIVGKAAAQDARAVLQAASTAMGAGNLKTIQYTGTTGWFGQFGQSFAPGANFPRTDLVSYTRTIDYDARSSREDLTRRQSNPPVQGGGAPFLGEQRITAIVNGNYAWGMQGENAVPQPAAAELRLLEIWTTPHGFLKAAMAANPTAISRTEIEDVTNTVRKVTIVSVTVLGKYRMNAQINEQNLIEDVMTWIPDSVLGDMLYEARYTEYKDFNGVKFPTLLHYHRGNRFLDLGHDVLEVRVTGVQPNVTAAALNVPDAVRQATIPPVRAESQRLGEGVWLIAGGSHNSVAVEFRDFVAVVEAPQNEQRSLAVIAEVTRLVPAKPIRYLVNTHHHFDHSGGLRTYVAHGATIITHQMNKDFYERVSFYPAPRTLQPDMLAQFPGRTAFGAPPTIEAVQQRYALSDGRRTLELYPVVNLGHAGTMLIAYLPTEKILINADMYSPPAQGAQVAPAAVPGMIALNRNIQRLKLDVAQHVPIHGQPGTHEQFMRMVAAAGSSN